MTRRDFAMTALGVASTSAYASSGAARAVSGLVVGKMSSGGLADLSARDAARHIREGAVTAESYATALLRQYRLHRDLNVAISIHEPSVLESARAVDRTRARGEVLGPLAGVPLIVKDQIDVVGYATTAGTPALRHYMPGRNAVVVDTLLRSGAIVFAKANMHELAYGVTSSNPTFGFVRNPYDRERIPGGSSGGTAAALAARIVPLGLGEDTGGSVRIPAGFCGVCGLRPSTWPTKRYSDAGIVPGAAPDDTQTIGPMARSVSDLALLDAVVTQTSEAQPVDLRRVRLGVPNENFWADKDVDRGVAASVQAALEGLRRAGVTLVPVDLRAVLALAAPLPFIPPDERARIALWLQQHVPGVTLQDLVRQMASQDVKAIFEAPAQPARPGSAKERAQQRSAAVAAYGRLYRDAGIVALAFPNPLIPAPPIAPHGDPVAPQIEVNGHRAGTMSVVGRYTTFAPRMGAPGLTLPAGLAAGLPVGLELEALPGQDSWLLGFALACEQVLKPLPAPVLPG
jgi:indoleacetamide hydrolase